MNTNPEWDELTGFLDTKLAAFPTTIDLWQSGWAASRNSRAVLQQFKAVEKPFADATEEALESWCARGLTTWPRMSPEVEALARLRLETATVFLHLHTVGPKDDPSSAVPFPTMPDPDFIRWLTMEWWERHGRQLACEVWLLRTLRFE